MTIERSLGALLGSLAITGLALISVAQQSGAKDPVFLTIDHASVCGSSLDALRQAFTSVGLSADYGGPHASGGTHMALVGFDDGSYLELIAPQGAEAAGQASGWARLMAADAGPCAWAIEPKDITQEVTRLTRAGIKVDGPKPGSRKRPDGMAIEWDVANVGSGTPGSLLPFLIQDRTPRQWRVAPSASLSGSAISGVEMVVLGVNDLNAAVDLFRQAYNWAPPLTADQRDFEAKLAYFPGQPVILASPLGGKSWLGGRLQKFGEGPSAYLLATQDYGSVAKKFRLSGAKLWFEQRVGWFDRKKLNGIRLGVIGP